MQLEELFTLNGESPFAMEVSIETDNTLNVTVVSKEGYIYSTEVDPKSVFKQHYTETYENWLNTVREYRKAKLQKQSAERTMAMLEMRASTCKAAAYAKAL
jgi:hypothetical protein